MSVSDALPLLEPKLITVTDGKGKTKDFVISKFDCIFGREVYSQYPLTALPKIGDYRENERLMLRCMAYVCVTLESGAQQRLNSDLLVKNHITDWEMLTGIERALGEHNFSFFRDGKAFSFFDGLCQIVQRKALETLTRLLEAFSQAEKPPSTN